MNQNEVSPEAKELWEKSIVRIHALLTDIIEGDNEIVDTLAILAVAKMYEIDGPMKELLSPLAQEMAKFIKNQEKSKKLEKGNA